jgi:hypothetical protein
MIIIFTDTPKGGSGRIEVFSFQVFPKMLKTERDMKRMNLSLGIEVKNQFKQYLEIEKAYFLRPKKFIFVPPCERVFLAAENFSEANCQTVAVRFKSFIDASYELLKNESGKIERHHDCTPRPATRQWASQEIELHEKWQAALTSYLSAQSGILSLINKAGMEETLVERCAEEAKSAGNGYHQQYARDCQMQALMKAKKFRKEAESLEAKLPKLAAAAEKSKKAWIAFCRKIMRQINAKPTTKKKETKNGSTRLQRSRQDKL